jgi:riboflavin biosynthesis pyrimidine reductase
LLIDNSSFNLFNSNELQSIENSIQLSLQETQNFDSDIMVKYKVLY